MRSIGGRKLYELKNVLRGGRYLAVRDIWVSFFDGSAFQQRSIIFFSTYFKEI